MGWHAMFLSGVVGLGMIGAMGCESSDDPLVDVRNGRINSSGYEEQLPRDAMRVGDERTFRNDAAARRDRGLYYVPSRDGRVYVRDEDTGRVIFSGKIASGEKFWLNLDRERATVDGRLVYEGHLTRGERYQLYFKPG
jgi:hypothetical protein